MPLRFTLRQLEYFVAVGEAGSIAAAAGRLNVSSPPISAAIAQLEAEFGLQLFLRQHARGLVLTPEGRRFLAQARAALAAAGALHDLAQDISGKVRGPLDVGCLPTVAPILLPGLRRGFLDAWPEVAFHQSERDQAGLIAGLRGAELDLALTYDLGVPSDLDFVALARLDPYAVLPGNHPLAGRAAVTLADLQPHPMVLLDLPLSVDYFLGLFDSAGLSPVIIERTRDIAMMRALVGQGFGYSIANIPPRSALSPDGLPLAHVPIAGRQRALRLGLLLPGGLRRSRTVAAFIDHCRARLTEESLTGR